MLHNQVGREANLLSLLLVCLQIFIWTDEHPNSSGEKQPSCCRLKPLLTEELIFNQGSPAALTAFLYFQPEIILPPSPCPPNPLLKAHKCCVGRKSRRELPADRRYFPLMYLPVDRQRTYGRAGRGVSHASWLETMNSLLDTTEKGMATGKSNTILFTLSFFKGVQLSPSSWFFSL